jgi:hypothetical protein
MHDMGLRRDDRHGAFVVLSIRYKALRIQDKVTRKG